MNLTEEQLTAINNHAIAEYPNECCGLIVAGEFIPTKNISPTPTQTFVMKQEVFNKALLSGKLEAVIHSHCIDPNEKQIYDPRWPSTKDMETWIATNIAWGIVATNGLEVSSILWLDDNEIAPLEGRSFIHGIHDCYSVVRDYYRTELKIDLINVPRGMGWWDNNQNLYEENFARAGFYEISEEEADVNDCCLFQVRSPVPNHAAVITGQNEILHHLFHRLSGYDRLDCWKKHIVKFLRYDPTLNTLVQRNTNVTSDTTTREPS